MENSLKIVVGLLTCTLTAVVACSCIVFVNYAAVAWLMNSMGMSLPGSCFSVGTLWGSLTVLSKLPDIKKTLDN
jgi:hypothetical protein